MYKRRYISFLFIVAGLVFLGFVVSPFLDLRIYQSTGSGEVVIPIPKTKVVKDDLRNILATNFVNFSGVDYTKAENWFPKNSSEKTESIVETYKFSIPKLKIDNATVSFVNGDLSKSLIHYGGSALPGKPGNSVVFGHSTLPQLFNPKDYIAIFATLHTLNVGDEVFLDYDGVKYKYKIFQRRITDPDDISVLSQQYDDSYLTVITCTPPGTYWKRLILKAKIEKVS